MNKSNSEPVYYNPGQVERIFQYCRAPDCFLLGGPADGNEGQVFKQRYPDTLIIGVEPNPEMAEFQMNHGFPGVIWPNALWDRCNINIDLTVRDNRCGSLVNYAGIVDDRDRHYITRTITIDEILSQYPQRQSVVVWIDIEGAEECAIMGADISMRESRIKLWNVEVNNTNKDRIIKMLSGYGYDPIEEFDVRHMDKTGRVISDIVFSL